MPNYSLVELEDLLITQGVCDLIGKEFAVKKGNYPKKNIISLVDYILNYLETENKIIKDSETFGYGCWIIQFVYNGMYIELHELKEVVDGINSYEFDLSLTFNFLEEQFNLCLSEGITPNIPKIGQKVAISKEIYDGSEVNGVRYDAPQHMSGWYLTSNSFDGDVNTLIVDYLYHILKERPDIAKFLALPSGYRFYKDGEGHNIWFDPEVS